MLHKNQRRMKAEDEEEEEEQTTTTPVNSVAAPASTTIARHMGAAATRAGVVPGVTGFIENWTQAESYRNPDVLSTP